MRKSEPRVPHFKRIPRHVAIIMDGNGRWAQKRKFPRIDGHKRGAQAVEEAIAAGATDRRGVLDAVCLFSRKLGTS